MSTVGVFTAAVVRAALTGPRTCLDWSVVGVRPVLIEWIEDVCRLLTDRGEITRDDLRENRARFRSALIFAILARLPGVRVETKPKATLRYP
jgi:hypothetical protein